MYANVDSATNKMDELCARISTVDPDIVGLTEIKPKNPSSSVLPQEFHIAGYTSFVNMTGRGSVLYVKNCYCATELVPNFCCEASTWCTIKLNRTETLVIGVIYRSPNCSDEQNALMEKTIRSVTGSNYRYFLLMGDFNYPQIDWSSECTLEAESHPAQCFLTCTQDCFLYQHIREPTHYRGGQTANILDLVFTNGDELMSDLLYTEPIGKSHHVTLTWNLACHQQRPVTKTMKYSYDKGDYEGARKFMAAVNWEEQLRDLALEEIWSMVKDFITEATRTYVPCFVVNDRKVSRRRKPPWMDEHAMAALRKKQKAYANYLKGKRGKDYLEYVKCRNKAKSEVRRAVRSYERDIARRAKKDPKAFYRYVNGKIKGRGVIPDLKDDNGSVINEDADKANAFNSFFSSVFTKEDTLNLPDISYRSVKKELADVNFTSTDVLKHLLNLKTDKSPGPDWIHPRLLKECAHELALPLYILYMKSLDDGNIPQDWKDGHVTPIYKKGSRADIGNYRPVSLTSVICKVMEKLLRRAFLDHMLDNEFISEHQHGFVPGRSCSTQLLEVLDKWTEILDRGGDIDVVYLDLAKAFDSVPHHRLLLKLESYGVQGTLLHWMKNFLTGRRQKVMVAGTGSQWAPVLSGVPQGSVLGPLLFICYINDMPDTISSFIYMYADDTKIVREVTNDRDCEELQLDLDSIQHWSEKWQIRFNSSKCKIMHLGHSSDRAEYKMIDNGVEVSLDVISEEKDLGVWIDNKLKFSIHVGHAVAKGNQVLGLIKRSFVYRDSDIMKRLFTAHVRPHLEYANAVCYPRFKKDMKQLEGVQRRATKLVIGFSDMTYENRLRAMELPSLVYRRYRGDMIEVYKYLYGMYSVPCNSLLKRALPSALRGHDYKLFKRQCHSQLRLQFFSLRVTNLWNCLPEDVVSAPSLNIFKGRLDKFWGDCQYSLDPEIFSRH